MLMRATRTHTRVSSSSSSFDAAGKVLGVFVAFCIFLKTRKLRRRQTICGRIVFFACGTSSSSLRVIQLVFVFSARSNRILFTWRRKRKRKKYFFLVFVWPFTFLSSLFRALSKSIPDHAPTLFALAHACALPPLRDSRLGPPTPKSHVIALDRPFSLPSIFAVGAVEMRVEFSPLTLLSAARGGLRHRLHVVACVIYSILLLPSSTLSSFTTRVRLPLPRRLTQWYTRVCLCCVCPFHLFPPL